MPVRPAVRPLSDLRKASPSNISKTAYSSDSESDQDKKVEHVTKHRPLTRLSKAEPEDRSATAPFARDAIRKKSESLAVPTDKESESLWRTKYQQLQEQHEETQKKLKELQYTNLYITKELKETREAAEKAQERNRNTLEKLRSKLESLEGGVNQKNQEAVIEVERENKKLQSEITKLKLELDRAKDTDGLIPHYRLAIMKVKAQTTALREKLEQLNEEKTALKQEMDVYKKACQEAEAKAQALRLQLQELEEVRKNELKEAEAARVKLLEEIQEIRSKKEADSQEELLQLRSQILSLRESVSQQKDMIAQLQGTIQQQREDYNLHLQAALELATSTDGTGQPKQEYYLIPVDTPATSEAAVPAKPQGSSAASKPPKKAKETPPSSEVKRSKHSEVPKTDKFDIGGFGIPLLQVKSPKALSLEKDMRILDEEIEELTQSLERAAQKFSHH